VCADCKLKRTDGILVLSGGGWLCSVRADCELKRADGNLALLNDDWLCKVRVDCWLKGQMEFWCCRVAAGYARCELIVG